MSSVPPAALAVVPALALLAFASVPLAVIDLREHRLPNRITLPLVPAMALLLGLAAWVAGEPGRFTRALTAGAVALGGFALLHALPRAGLGLGDVKLAPTLGMALGWWSWDAVLGGALLAFATGSVTAIVLLVVRRASWRSPVPFGPAMLAGAWAAIALQAVASPVATRLAV